MIGAWGGRGLQAEAPSDFLGGEAIGSGGFAADGDDLGCQSPGDGRIRHIGSSVRLDDTSVDPAYDEKAAGAVLGLGESGSVEAGGD